MGKVIFVNCDPEDAKVFGVIVRFKDSPSGYRFFAFKADLKIVKIDFIIVIFSFIVVLYFLI